jgi:hypothetical protein
VLLNDGRAMCSDDMDRVAELEPAAGAATAAMGVVNAPLSICCCCCCSICSVGLARTARARASFTSAPSLSPLLWRSRRLCRSLSSRSCSCSRSCWCRCRRARLRSNPLSNGCSTLDGK